MSHPPYHRFITDVIGLVLNKNKIIENDQQWFKTHVFVVTPKVGVSLFCINQSFIRDYFEFYHWPMH